MQKLKDRRMEAGALDLASPEVKIYLASEVVSERAKLKWGGQVTVPGEAQKTGQHFPIHTDKMQTRSARGRES